MSRALCEAKEKRQSKKKEKQGLIGHFFHFIFSTFLFWRMKFWK
jgi:hypothetical protein